MSLCRKQIYLLQYQAAMSLTANYWKAKNGRQKICTPDKKLLTGGKYYSSALFHSGQYL
jgi:hypothetical protein